MLAVQDGTQFRGGIDIALYRFCKTRFIGIMDSVFQIRVLSKTQHSGNVLLSERACSSVVEHMLGKRKVPHSIPDISSLRSS